jgi:hypothetical protein
LKQAKKGFSHAIPRAGHVRRGLGTRKMGADRYVNCRMPAVRGALAGPKRQLEGRPGRRSDEEIGSLVAIPHQEDRFDSQPVVSAAIFR